MAGKKATSQASAQSKVSQPTYPTGLGTGTRQRRIPSTPNPPAAASQETPDFSLIDFDRLWLGREKVTVVEGSLLLEAVADEPPGRGLEIGSGSGRLTSYLARWSQDLVASDATISLLRRRSPSGNATPPRVGANLYHLPFPDGAFSVVTLVRVFGFLSDPEAGLREIHRVLRPRGALVLSFEPHPTVASLVDDLKVSFGRSKGEPVSPRSFSRASTVPVRPSAYPAWSHTRNHVRSMAEAAGFVLEREYPCGLEDLAGFRRLPASVFLSLSRALSRAGGFPTRFVLLRKRPTTGLRGWSE
jgi:SAM-dependent methyltransferase